MNAMRRTLNLLVGSTIVLTLSGAAIAQAKPSEAQPAAGKPCEAGSYPTAIRRHECFEANRVIKTYRLAHTFQQSDANEILIAIRNTLDVESKLFMIASQKAIVIAAPPDQQDLAQKIISELDRPRKLYRLTFTVAESNNGKRVGAQHFEMVVEAGQRTTLKQGSKVPVMTSMYNANAQSPESLIQYEDVGMNFDATLDDSGSGALRLKSKVEQSSVADEHMPGQLATDPIVHQTVLEGTTLLIPGKSATLGSADVAGSARHIDIEVVAEPIS